MTYSLREALVAFRRAPLLAGVSAAMIALSLFVIGLFGIVAYNIRKVIEGVEARVEVVAYLRDDASPADVLALRHELTGLPAVREVHYVSREGAAGCEDDIQFSAVFACSRSNRPGVARAAPPEPEGPDVVRRWRSAAANPAVEEVAT
jgi:hypothetical protein